MSSRTSRRSKIAAIPLNRPEGLAIAQIGDEDLKTGAEEIAECINEVNAEDEPAAELLAIQEEPVAEPLAIEDAPNPKPGEHVKLRLKLSLNRWLKLSCLRHRRR